MTHNKYLRMVLPVALAAAAVFPVLGAEGVSPSGNEARLADAEMNGDTATVQKLLKEHADANAAQGDGMTALHWAAFRQRADDARLLLQAGASVKATTRIGALTPLMLASRNGNPEVIETLVKAGGDVNGASTTGETPLMAAAASGNVKAVDVLLDHGASVNAKETAHGQTALMFAAADNRADAIRELLKHGADASITTNVQSLEPAKFDDNGNPLPKKNASTVTGGNKIMGGMTALLFAARNGNLSAVQTLIDGKADVNEISKGDQGSPLIIAAANGHYEVAKYLVDHGANPNVENVDGLTALYATIDTQYAPVSWAPVPLTEQEKVSHIELVKALLSHGANPNVRIKRKLWFSPSSHDQQWISPAGATPFWRAAEATDVEAMRILVQAGADPKLNASTGSTPLMMASGLGWAGNFSQTNDAEWADAVKYCIELGLDVNAADSQGYTPLMGAAWRGNDSVIQYLVSKGGNLEMRNKRGWSITDMANGPALRSSVPMTHPETIAFVLKLGAPQLTKISGEAILGSTRKGRGGAASKAPAGAAKAPSANGASKAPVTDGSGLIPKASK